jgi:DME family drug/metabolite transporter
VATRPGLTRPNASGHLTLRGNALRARLHGSTGSLLVLAAAFLWGTSGTAQALAPTGATPLVIGGIRVGIGGLFLFLGALVRGRFMPARRVFRPIILVAGATQALFNVAFFSGIALTGVAVGTMVAIGSTPIFAGALGIVFNGDRVSWKWYAATAVAIAGLVMLVTGGGSGIRVDLSGILFALTAGFAYSFFTLLGGRLVRYDAPDVVIGVSFLVATVILVPFFPSGSLAWIARPAGTLSALYLGLISSGVAYMLYGRGLQRVAVSSVGTLTLAEPLTAAILGVFFLGEPVHAITGVGMGLLFVAQVALVRDAAKAG